MANAHATSLSTTAFPKTAVVKSIVAPSLGMVPVSHATSPAPPTTTASESSTATKGRSEEEDNTHRNFDHGSFSTAVAISGYAGEQAYEAAKLTISEAIRQNDARPRWFDLFEDVLDSFKRLRRAKLGLIKAEIQAIKFHDRFRNKMSSNNLDGKERDRYLAAWFGDRPTIANLFEIEHWNFSCYSTLRRNVNIKRKKCGLLRQRLEKSMQEFDAAFKQPENNVLMQCFDFLGNTLQVEPVYVYPELGCYVLHEIGPTGRYQLREREYQRKLRRWTRWKKKYGLG